MDPVLSYPEQSLQVRHWPLSIDGIGRTLPLSLILWSSWQNTFAFRNWCARYHLTHSVTAPLALLPHPPSIRYILQYFRVYSIWFLLCWQTVVTCDCTAHTVCWPVLVTGDHGINTVWSLLSCWTLYADTVTVCSHHLMLLSGPVSQ
jgi:hypothetical protein